MALRSRPVTALPRSNEPLFSEGLCTAWPACKLWNLDYLDNQLDCPLKFRLGKKECEEVQWEPDCPSLFASIRQFWEWTTGCMDSNNPLYPYKPDSWWAYADYLHMKPGSELEGLRADLDWCGTFGLTGSSISPTFWLGSSGAYSICHYDTYGINVVVQIFGQKRWTLFPNSDGPHLYETRVPLEESTVFSEVNFPHPNLLKYPLVSNTSPRTILLNPGDALFVPRGWWHFVESTDRSPVTCSVNLWLDEPALDDAYRLREALTQIAAFSMISGGSLNEEDILHLNEKELYGSKDWYGFLTENIQSLLLAARSASSDDELPEKKSKGADPLWVPLSKRTIKECFTTSTQIPDIYKSNSVKTVDDKTILKAFLKPDVIDLVARHLEQGF